jgi:hypothetical protein
MPTVIGENSTKKKLAANELVLCMGVNQLRTPNIAMIAAACGFDAVYIDLEHNPTSLETAAGVASRPGEITRSPRSSHDRTRPVRLRRDHGAACPERGRGQGDRRACSMRQGHRSACAAGARLCRDRPGRGVPRSTTRRSMAMIETPEAVSSAESDRRGRGIDVLHIGASDLSTRLSPARAHARGLETVAKATRSRKGDRVGGCASFEFRSDALSWRALPDRRLRCRLHPQRRRADVKQLRELKLG